MRKITYKEIADLPTDAQVIFLRATDEYGKDIGVIIKFKYVEGTGSGTQKRWIISGNAMRYYTNAEVAKMLNYEARESETIFNRKCKIVIENYDGDVLPYSLNAHKTTIKKAAVRRPAARKPTRK